MNNERELLYAKLREIFPDLEVEKKKKRKRMNNLPVECYTQDWTYVATYSSAMDAEKQTGIPGRQILEACIGHRKTAGGYMWRRRKLTAEEEQERKEEKRKRRNQIAINWYNRHKKKVGD